MHWGMSTNGTAMRLLLWGILVAALSYTQAYPEHGAFDISEGLNQKARSRRQSQSCDGCDLERVTEQLARQLELQRLYIDERIRSDGGSGIKQTRLTKTGSKTYHATSFTGSRIVAAHEHANNIRVVGLGEFIAVLNGVEFRTRHNDYKIVMPHSTDGAYEKTQNVPYPLPPPAVTDLPNAEDQIVEMREWFKAWRDQDYSVRDYRPYFKPALCYLEGAWTLPEGTAIDESFDSDRHHIDATTWFDLQEKIKFTSYSGKKDREENYAYLPTTIIKVLTNGTVQLVIAQWNYRILCHPLSNDLPTSRLRLIDDLQSRMGFQRSIDEHIMSRAARFQVNPDDKDEWDDRIKFYQLIDELMEEIPGKDNYIGDLSDTGLGDTLTRFQSTEPLNAAYYHGWFSGATDAMGSTRQHRGYADENLYMAMTTQEKVAPVSLEKCVTKNDVETCTTYTQRWSYAIPLEIIYLNPLYKWNPYGIKWKDYQDAKTVTADGRNGDPSLDKAFNGSNGNTFYRTPATFFQDTSESNDSADTTAGARSALDQNGGMHSVVASGPRILLPDIPGVGVLRSRYPIMPTHAEGSATWKELDALKDLMLRPTKYREMSYNNQPKPEPGIQVIKTSLFTAADPHVHYLVLTKQNVRDMTDNPLVYNVTVETTAHEEDGHTHIFTVVRNKQGGYRYDWCDDKRTCKGGHSKWQMYCAPDPVCLP